MSDNDGPKCSACGAYPCVCTVDIIGDDPDNDPADDE